MTGIPATHPYRDGEWERDIYPMPSFPMIAVADVDSVSQWYQAIGFVDVFTMRDPAGKAMLAHLRWCRYADVLISRARVPHVAIEAPGSGGVIMNFMTFSPDEVAERARAAGVNIIEGPVNRPWNARDVLLADPQGNRLNFTGPVPRDESSGESFNEVVARVSKL